MKKLNYRMEKTSLIRLNKFMSEIGYCSRREADRLIASGKVLVNGEKAEMGVKVGPDEQIIVNGELLNQSKNKNIYLAFNKPKGIVCTSDTRVEKNNIIEFINYPKRIFPIGRLDKPSEGLIFLTNDGDIVNKILRSRNNHEKEYIVTVNKPITPDFIRKMSNGIPILNTVTKKCFVKQTHKNQFRIILTQGLNRQIRRMCEYLNYRVNTLKRVRIMNVKLDIKLGKWRHLRADELKKLNQLLSDSLKTVN